ncbi:hypothetical protein GCM10023213_13280 [Prosthecobacter algae]|uniref:Uncharacterized protein n=1 Tax=Prosthecobacter algae TaxID=1144682 RepID=A0ABP9NYX3_9BACT
MIDALDNASHRAASRVSGFGGRRKPEAHKESDKEKENRVLHDCVCPQPAAPPSRWDGAVA